MPIFRSVFYTTKVESKHKRVFEASFIITHLFQLKYFNFHELMVYFFFSIFRLLGYQFTDDIMEKPEQYLNRISGLQRLYSAIMTAKLRRSQTNLPHPHGLENGWIWLSNILMLDPLPEIFPTLILRFMEICGPEMLSAYGKQFVKLIIALQSQYIPKLDQIDSGGPFSRLKGLIESIITENRIEDMKGTLPANFW